MATWRDISRLKDDHLRWPNKILVWNDCNGPALLDAHQYSFVASRVASDGWEKFMVIPRVKRD